MKIFMLVKDALELMSYLAILFGIPIALHQARKTALKEQADREYGTYNALDEKYLEFMSLCFDCPHLDVFDIQDKTRRELSEIDAKKELIAFTMLFSIFERSYLMYFDQKTEVKSRQWSGWLDYMTQYCARENYRTAWSLSGKTFDIDFQDFMEKLIQGTG